MEKMPDLEGNEIYIERRIEEIARIEGVSKDDIISDISTFAELMSEDGDAKFYFVELAEKVGISTEEMIKYALGSQY